MAFCVRPHPLNGEAGAGSIDQLQGLRGCELNPCKDEKKFFTKIMQGPLELGIIIIIMLL